VVSYASNLFFNAADLGDEIYMTIVYTMFEDYENLGKNLAKITSDLLLKSPFRNSYNYRNSEFIKYRMYTESSGVD